MSLAVPGDRTVTNASLAVYAHEYRYERAADRGPRVDGLVVTTTRAAAPALFHPTSALYGFTDLQPGTNPTRILLVDPLRRYLPRVALATVPDRSEVSRALLAGAVNPPRGARPPVVAVPLRPAIGYAFRPGDTVVWGSVTGPGGRPVPFARIEVLVGNGDADAVQVATYTDLNGVYAADLRRERVVFVLPPEPEEDDPPAEPPPEPTLERTFARKVRCYPPTFEMPRNLLPGDETRALASFPARFDEMTDDAAVRDASYGPAQTLSVAVTVGGRNELRFTNP